MTRAVRTGSKKLDRVALVLASPFIAVAAVWFAAKMMWEALTFSVRIDFEFFRRQWREAGSKDFNRKRDPEEIEGLLEEIEARMYDARMKGDALLCPECKIVLPLHLKGCSRRAEVTP